jgi:FKBP-type peptidyl-prolyl cis-trans isomerase
MAVLNYKKTLSTIALGFLCITGTASSLTDKDKKNDNIKASYTIGYDIGYTYKDGNDLLDIEALNQGIQNGLNAEKSQITIDEMRKSMAKLRSNIYTKLSSDNLNKSSSFMKKIAKQGNLTKINNNLYYKVEKSGKGESPKPSDTVKVKFQGKLANNDYIFYDTFKYNVTEDIALNSALKGWQESVMKMKKGDIWTVYLGPSMAYGDKAPTNIGPNQALIYRIELIDIIKNK